MQSVLIIKDESIYIVRLTSNYTVSQYSFNERDVPSPLVVNFEENGDVEVAGFMKVYGSPNATQRG